MAYPDYENIIVEFPADGVGLVRINRPKVLNALNAQVMTELVDALQRFDADDDVGCMVLTGSERAFAAGADIGEMAGKGAIDMYLADNLTRWDAVRRLKKPVIAAVSGFALGGGCELAMACDIIVASETARFGQPEINIGVIPGAGGTQRLTRAVGKAKAMELILTGRHFTAAEAESCGLVSRVVPAEAYLDAAIEMAGEIASKPPLAVRLAKDAVLKAQDTTIETGLAYERHNFYMLFASEDQKEGMDAFLEKRRPRWKGR